MQRDVDDVAIGLVLGHLDPVADLDHVVSGELDARDQREDRVLEDQQQDRGHRTEAAQEDQRALIEQRRDDDDDRDDSDGQLDELQIALDRTAPVGAQPE